MFTTTPTLRTENPNKKRKRELVQACNELEITSENLRTLNTYNPAINQSHRYEKRFLDEILKKKPECSAKEFLKKITPYEIILLQNELLKAQQSKEHKDQESQPKETQNTKLLNLNANKIKTDDYYDTFIKLLIGVAIFSVVALAITTVVLSFMSGLGAPAGVAAVGALLGVALHVGGGSVVLGFTLLASPVLSYLYVTSALAFQHFRHPVQPLLALTLKPSVDGIIVRQSFQNQKTTSNVSPHNAIPVLPTLKRQSSLSNLSTNPATFHNAGNNKSNEDNEAMLINKRRSSV